jgi:class 3 adenylate cyclase
MRRRGSKRSLNAEVVRAHQLRVREAIVRFGGIIARYVGDGALIYRRAQRRRLAAMQLTKLTVVNLPMNDDMF